MFYYTRASMSTFAVSHGHFRNLYTFIQISEIHHWLVKVFLIFILGLVSGMVSYETPLV